MGHNHHIAATTTAADSSSKRRGSYNCGRCGQPKKGHVCHINPSTPVTQYPAMEESSEMSSNLCLRRALSFDDVKDTFPEVDLDLDLEEEENEGKFMDVVVDGGLVESCMLEVMGRLGPVDLMEVGKVCRSWRDLSKKVWSGVEELRITVPKNVMVGGIVSVLRKCPMLKRLVLRMESDFDATTLACIAFSCPNLESLEITMSEHAVNWITGDDLSRFVGDKHCLTSLKMEGCANLDNLLISSLCLTTLWLSDLNCLSKTVFNCPNLVEVSMVFSHQGSDNTDLPAMMNGLGRGCPMLQNVHIASVRLTHRVVLALTAADLRGLRMLSLIWGSGITDASVAAISSSYSELELLDLSGSSISDSGIGMICGVFPRTLSRLLLALCPHVTTSGIQFATEQLPRLEVLDCGMTLSFSEPESETPFGNKDLEVPVAFKQSSHFALQKLVVKHDRLKKFSLWGCSALDALFLNCPRLNDLNLTSCQNLEPGKLVLQCPKLETVHASGCSDKLIPTIEKQIFRHTAKAEDYYPSKRMADSSKRVRVPLFLQPSEYDLKDDRPKKRQCILHVG